MGRKPATFVTNHPIELEQIAGAVCGRLVPESLVGSARNVRLLDTPDRRLAAAGLRLEVGTARLERHAKTRSTQWRLIDDQETDRASAIVERAPKTPMPRFADDLPDSPLRSRLIEIAEMRALQPWASLKVEERAANLRDGVGKTRVRLRWYRIEIDIDGAVALLPIRVLVEPLKGYQSDADTVSQLLSERSDWSACKGGLLTGLNRELEATPTPPGFQVNVPAPAIGLETPAGPALRRILSQLLDTLDSRRNGVIADIDSEFLHEFRVAVRRSRSALQQLGEVLPDEIQGQAREGYRWLGQVTGPARDLDVHILAFKAHCQSLTPEQATALAPLGAHLIKSKSCAHKTLIRDLKSERYQSFIRCCRTILATDAPAWIDTEIKRQPIADVVGRQVLHVYRKAVRHGARIGADTEATALHDLRKKLKKLRYLIEFMKNMFPKNHIRPFLRKLKTLQEVLGDVQDLEIQTDALHRFGRELATTAQPDTLPDTLMAIGAWAEDLDRRRAQARARFAEVFAPFAHDETAKAFRATFSPKRRMHDKDPEGAKA